MRAINLQAGFSYIGLLIAIAILGAASAATLTAGASMQRRAAEDELLFVGSQFQDALKSYYESTPPGAKPHPARLEDLLLDKRTPVPRRHLRKVFVDPLTGKPEWGTVFNGGGISGIYSLAAEQPIRIAGFDDRFSSFAGKQKYSDWVFGYLPPAFQNNQLSGVKLP